MPVFIAKRHDGKVQDVVMAKNYDLANAYWHGKGVAAHFVTMLTQTDLDEHPTGVIPIVSTKEKSIKQEFGTGFMDLLLVD